MISILIPTCKQESEIQNQITDIKNTISLNSEIIYSCTKNSASINRNICLNKALGDTIIMLDDDITGFFQGWDNKLIELLNKDDIMLVSARLLKTTGENGFMMGDTGNHHKDYIVVEKVPTACVAFRKNNIRFDENFIGSGFEDDDFIKQMKIVFPNKNVIINNNCRLIHINEMKNQHNEFWTHNQKYYYKKYPKEAVAHPEVHNK